MKKILPLAVLALAAVTTACSSDDDKGTPANPKDAIAFAKPFVQNSVMERTATTKIDFESFKVWGFVKAPDSNTYSYIFEGNNVTNNPTAGGWQVDRTEYWYPNMQYYFTGIAPGEKVSTTDAPQCITFAPITEPADTYTGGGTITFDNNAAEGRVDLVYAWAPNKNNSATDSPVDLTFNHLLSRVMFSFKNFVSPSTSLVIYNMELVGSTSKGSIDMSSNQTWTATADEVTPLSIKDITSGASLESKLAYNQDGNISESVYVIPTTESISYQLQFKVDVYNGQTNVATYSHTVNLPKIKYEKANSYKFNATFDSKNLNPAGPLNEIKFDVVTVGDWAENNINLPEPK